MPETPTLNRRDAMRVGLLAAVGATAVTIPAVAQDPKQPPAEKNPWQLRVDIPGAPAASTSALGVEMDPLTVEVVASEGRKRGPFRPGAAHWGQARFTGVLTAGAGQEVRAWIEDEGKLRSIRKNITVSLTRSGKEGGARTFALIGCLPTDYSVVDVAAEGNAGATMRWTLEVRVDRIEMK